MNKPRKPGIVFSAKNDAEKRAKALRIMHARNRKIVQPSQSSSELGTSANSPSSASS